MRRSWVPSKDHTSTGRLCSIGSGHHPVPRRRSSYAALRLPHLHRPRLRSSLAFGLPRRGRFFCAARCSRQRVRPANTLCVGDRSPALRLAGRFARRSEGLPGCWAVLFVRAVVEDPAGCGPRLAPWRRVRRGLQAIQHPGLPEWHSFRGCMAYGPHARAPTLQRTRYRERCKARYRSRRAHP